MKFEFEIPEKVSANKIYAGVHWGARKKIVDNYHQAILELKLKKRFKKKVDIMISFYFKNRPLDCSNCFFMAKCVEDGMVKSSMLIDDSPKYVRSIMCKSKVDKENPRIEVEVKEC